MIDLVRHNREALVSLCRRYGVRTLDLFGSAAQGTFDPATSDLDFVIDFQDYGSGIARRFHDFATDVEALFGRSVDLVFDSGMKNPYFRAMVNATREPLYDADRDREAAAWCVERSRRDFNARCRRVG
jgi:predicted nucleotidyltransferase